MSRHPLLLIPTPEISDPASRFGGPGKLNKPSITRQAQRLSPLFSRLEDAIEKRRVEVQLDAPGLDPEYTLVIETYGSIQEFFTAVKMIDGLEWLGEYEVLDLEPTDDFFDGGKKKDKLISGQVMLMLSDREAIRQLLSLWRKYGTTPNMAFGEGWAKYRDLFQHIKDIRYWSTEDRLRNTGVLEYWQEQLEYDPDTPIRFETELWFRKHEDKRKEAHRTVTSLVESLGGKVITTSCISEINYHSFLIELPAVQIEHIISDRNVSLVKCDQIMFFRPLGQMTVEPLWSDSQSFDEGVTSNTVQYSSSSITTRQPRVALLDGLPIANHEDLLDSLIIDDPDDFANNYPADCRIHGTAMASLIVNGDLNEGGAKLGSSIYVRPILKPDFKTLKKNESIPDTELPIDLLHRAVRRMFEGDGAELPVAPSVKVINLSIGDPNIHFDGKMSPFARLIDWLSEKYQVLFIVSAGNHSTAVPIEQTASQFQQLTAEEKTLELFKALQKDTRNRKLLSPAESVNAITVGSIHDDSSSYALRPGLYDLYTEQMPASYSAHGNGYQRSVKPDIVIPGGRMLHNEPIFNPELTSVTNLAAPGQLVAYPHTSMSNYRLHIRGTSNSAALASRGCAEICDVVEGLFDEEELASVFDSYASVLLKALMVHGSSRSEYHYRISSYLGKMGARELKSIVAMNVGYGRPDFDRVKFCLDTRATILGYGSLSDSQAHVYSIPLPEDLGGVDTWRRLTVSLAWFAKPCATNMKYRDSAVWFTVEGENRKLTPRDKTSVDWQQVKRGTLQHEVFEGEDLVVLSKSKSIDIKVNCKDNAGKIIEPVKYGLIVTLEVADDVDIDVYEKVKQGIAEQIRDKAREQVPIR
nr:S8 family peptidase [Vibrio cholerae]ELC9718581.1 S8 family peptidase [Vibrio vulnificus]GHY73151.1 S8A family peptidase [Vibrio cholerae]GHZ28180.1 S8A family peptidase [Vibrio cholerae]